MNDIVLGQEPKDADRVDKAHQLLQAGDRPGAKRILLEVVNNAPQKADYVYREERDGKQYIKFWDMSEFLHFVAWIRATGVEDEDTEVFWIRSAYPRALCLLGGIFLEEGDPLRAAYWLEKGIALEPTNPKLVTEIAQAFVKLGHLPTALALFGDVDAVGPYVSVKDLARALRGKGFVLIELGRLDEAESAFQESLAHQPDSQIAHDELAYIAALRVSGKKAQAPATLLRSFAGLSVTCSRCGARCQSTPVQVGAEGPVCDACLRNQKKKWWQFW